MFTTRLAAALLSLLVMLMGFFGLTMLAHAEAPAGTGFTYQGRLVRDGAPATGSYDFQFELYDGAGGAAGQVGPTLTRAAVSVVEGRFTVQLDFGDMFTGAPRYLAIAVRPGDSGGSYTSLSPRQALTAVPYADHANRAHEVPWSGLTGVPADLADGDSNTTYSAGNGLTLGGTTLALDTSVTDGRYWTLGGNAGTDPGTHVLGTTDEVTLTLAVNDTAALRLGPASTPNLIGGHNSNTVGSNVVGATIGGGGTAEEPNHSLADFATVGGGRHNIAGHFYATVGGGHSNIASGRNATVGGGWDNIASGSRATVGGGWNNTASGAFAMVGGGWDHTASGYAATVGGGRSNIAAGSYSFAAGQRAKIDAAHDGSFVWADRTFVDFTSIAANEFAARATGGVRFVTAVNTSTGAPTASCSIPAGGGSWNCTSDRNAKANFAAVNSDEILAGVLELPIQSWNYKSQDEAIRHIGPMAQDFAAAFEVGVDDTHISMVDADGVALAAIQGLHELVQEKDTRIVTLEDENAELKSESATQQAQIEQVQQQNAELGAENAAQQEQIEGLTGQVETLQAQNAELIERLEQLEQAVQGLQDGGSQ